MQRSISAAIGDASRFAELAALLHERFYETVRASASLDDAEAILNVIASEYVLALVNFVRTKHPVNNVAQMQNAAYIFNSFSELAAEQVSNIIASNAKMWDGKMEVPCTVIRPPKL